MQRVHYEKCGLEVGIYTEVEETNREERDPSNVETTFKKHITRLILVPYIS
jgi:hypothetical protein